MLESNTAVIIWSFVGVLAVVCALFYGFWLLGPILAGLPWRPTSAQRVRRAVSMANAQPGETFYDLGSGDGRVLLQAAREFGLRAVGIELSPVHCWLSKVRARRAGLAQRVSIRREDFFHGNLADADVVFAYMTSAQAARLKPHLENQLKAGARVVTISFDIDGWEPREVDREQLIFLYEMPPRPGSLETYLARHG